MRKWIIVAFLMALVTGCKSTEEKPRREGHDETSWGENRRVDIVHAGE